MARAHAIETRIEKLNPSLDEYFTSGFLSHDEICELVRKRKHWEYRLVAKPLLLLDVQDAVKYELGLERDLRIYCESTKVQFKHRWAILERIEYIYRVGLKHLKEKSEWECIRKEFVSFLKQYHRHGSLSKLYGELMVKYPTRSELWVEAALWEAVGLNKVHNARAIIQQALLTMASDPVVWAAGLRVELNFVQYSLRRYIEEFVSARSSKKARKEVGHSFSETVGSARPVDSDGESKQRLSAQMRSEDANMCAIMLDLELCKAIVCEALEGPAFSPALITSLLSVAGEFVFSRELVCVLLKDSQRRMLEVLASSQTTQRVRTEWQERGLVSVLQPYIVMEHILVNKYRNALVDSVTFVDNEGIIPKPSPESRRTATIQSLATVLTAAVEKRPGVMNMIGNPGAVARLLCQSAFELLSAVKGYCRRGVSRICSTLLNTQTIDVSDAVRWLLNVEWLSKDQTKTYVIWARERVQGLEQLVEETLGAAASVLAGTFAKPSVAKLQDNSSELYWTSGLLSDLIDAEDRVAVRPLLVDTEKSRRCAQPLNADALDRFLLSLRQGKREREKGSGTSRAAIGLAQRKEIEKFLIQYSLLSSSADTPVTQESDSSDKTVCLLRSKHALLFKDSKTTPLSIWRLFSALETLSPQSLSFVNDPEHSEDDENKDEDEHDYSLRENRSNDFKSFTEAGLNFIASVNYASLSRVEQWERACAICTLLRSRFHTFTGQKRFTRAELLSWMCHSESKSSQLVVQALFSEMRNLLHPPNGQLDRCQPLPRFCLAQVMLPFLEALVLFYDRRKADKGRREDALREARAVHERVISLYQFTKHLEDFIPLLYDGVAKDVQDMKASRETVESLNAEDWVSFVIFEREVAKDLNQARVVAERARRWTLAPQLLLVKLNNS